jgi:Fur family ferric uptake transcriptional regulator
MTTQRRVILEELKKLKSHPTARDLCAIVRKRVPRISLGTVYRNLEILARQGLVQKLEVGGFEMRFDGESANHYHLRCLSCGRVDDVDVKLLDGLDKALRGATDFQVLGHRLEFVGICPDCRRSDHNGRDKTVARKDS